MIVSRKFVRLCIVHSQINKALLPTRETGPSR